MRYYLVSISCYSPMIQNGPKNISPDELLVGDIVFFMNALEQPSHVAIYAGNRAGTHFITHGVSEPYNSIMTTRLKHDDFPYRVFRCTDFNLSMQATCRMLSWVKTGLRFSHEKHESFYSNFTDAYPNCHPKVGGQKQLEAAKKDFEIIFYRYIAMASHPELPFMVNGSQNEGVYCSEAITMAFNMETLLSAEAVHSIDKINANWVTDKTLISPKSIEEKFKPHPNYWTYFERANSPMEYQPYGILPENAVKDGHFPCSLSAWNYERYPSIEQFIKQYPFCLPLDSKISSPWAMMTQMQQVPGLWQDMGQLKVPVINYRLEDLESQQHKEEWKEYVVQLFQQREIFHSKFEQDLAQSIDGFERFKYSPQKKKQKIELTRGRSFSSDLGNLLRHQLIEPDNAKETEDSVYASAQLAVYNRAFKYVSPIKKSSSTDASIKVGSDIPCRRKLF